MGRHERHDGRDARRKVPMHRASKDSGATKAEGGRALGYGGVMASPMDVPNGGSSQLPGDAIANANESQYHPSSEVAVRTEQRPSCRPEAPAVALLAPDLPLATAEPEDLCTGARRSISLRCCSHRGRIVTLVERSGFERLTAEGATGGVGTVVGFKVSRLARNNAAVTALTQIYSPLV